MSVRPAAAGLGRRGEVAEQAQRLRAGGDAEFVVQGSDTEPVLTGHKLLPVFRGVASHQQPVRRLATWIARQRKLAETLRGSKLPEIEIDLPKAFKCFQVKLAQVPLLWQVPIPGNVVFEERATIKPDRPLIVVGGLMGMTRRAG